MTRKHLFLLVRWVVLKDTDVLGGTTRNSILTIWAELGTHGLEPDLGSVKQNWIGWVIQVNTVKVFLL